MSYATEGAERYARDQGVASAGKASAADGCGEEEGCEADSREESRYRQNSKDISALEALAGLLRRQFHMIVVSLV